MQFFTKSARSRANTGHGFGRDETIFLVEQKGAIVTTVVGALVLKLGSFGRIAVKLCKRRAAVFVAVRFWTMSPSAVAPIIFENGFASRTVVQVTAVFLEFFFHRS